jgi:tetratricopeptide (TPR) repeat protein
MATQDSQAERPRGMKLDSPCTRVELFLWGRNLKPAAVAREASINRHYFLRVRKARLEPTRQKIAAMVGAARRLLHENIRPEEMFELSAEEGGLWLTAAQRDELLERGRVTRRTEQAIATLVSRIIYRPRAEWRRAFAGETPHVALFRQILSQAMELLDSEPAEAAALLEILHDLVVNNSQTLHPDETIELRGQTFLQRAYAQRQLGDYSKAATLLDEAERIFETTPYCMVHLARTWYEMGALEFKRGELDRALRLARRARCTFVVMGDYRREAYALVVEGCISFEEGELQGARDLFTRALKTLRTFDDGDALGCAYLNLGSVANLLQDVAAAKSWLAKAIAIFTKKRVAGEIVRTRWSAARVRVMHENRRDGLAQLRQARSDFLGLGMLADAAFVALDLVKFLLEDRTALDEAVALARAAYNDLQRAGAPANALRAMEHLREALRLRSANAKLVEEVQQFIKRAPYRPEAEFAPERVA